MNNEKCLKAYSEVVPLIKYGAPFAEVSDDIGYVAYCKIRKICGVKRNTHSDKYLLIKYKDIIVMIRRGISLSEICNRAYPITAREFTKLRKLLGMGKHYTITDENMLFKYADVVSYILNGEGWKNIHERGLCSKSVFYQLKNIIDRKNGKNKSSFILPERR